MDNQLNRWRQASSDNRLIMLAVSLSEEAGNKALEKAMWTVDKHNNNVTRYISDAIAQKLVRDETGYTAPCERPNGEVSAIRQIADRTEINRDKLDIWWGWHWAAMEGRLYVLPDRALTETEKQAFNSVVNIMRVSNNAVNNYTAAAVIEQIILN